MKYLRECLGEVIIGHRLWGGHVVWSAGLCLVQQSEQHPHMIVDMYPAHPLLPVSQPCAQAQFEGQQHASQQTAAMALHQARAQ